MQSKILLLHNVNIVNPTRKFTQASSIAIQHGRIIAVGDSTDLLSEFDGRSESIDMGQRAILPGLTDAHIHLQNYAFSLQKIDCETTTKQECLSRVAQKVLETRPGEWILGHGWNQNEWEDGFGNRHELDQVAPHNPVYLTAKSLHASWANSLALRHANITSTINDPVGGRIGRAEDGQPDGILFETAMELIGSVLPEPSIETIETVIAQAIPRLWRLGLTGIHDFDRRPCFQALQRLSNRDELRLRVVKSLPYEDLPHIIAVGLQSGFGNEFLRIGAIKAFADGALGPQTAAMLQSYENDPDNKGILMLDAEELFENGRQAVKNGLSLAVHAIGDRANHEVLDAITQLRSYESNLGLTQRPKLRHRIEHVQVIHPDDAERLSALGITASMQPIHATSDMDMADKFWGSRSANAYAWKSQLQAGSNLAFGSDAPVESPNPFWGIHAAVTRRRQDGRPSDDGWYPEQRLSFREALLAYTMGPAYAAGLEGQLGELAPGFLADLIVLEIDPTQHPPDRLFELRPSGTMLGGEWVFRAF